MDIKKLCEKLYTLSIRGDDGEKELAKKNLEKLMKKYNLSEMDVTDEKTEFFDIRYHKEYERRLLQQIGYKVTNSKECLYEKKSYKRTLKVVVFKCTKAQFIEIEYLYSFYKELFEKELDVFVSAFIQTHRLFGELQEGESPREIDSELLRKMSMLGAGMEMKSPLKPIEMLEKSS